mgnify:CR=1 FL=1
MLLCICFACSNNKVITNIDNNKNLIYQPENLYKLAKISFDQQNFELGMPDNLFGKVILILTLFLLA